MRECRPHGRYPEWSLERYSVGDRVVKLIYATEGGTISVCVCVCVREREREREREKREDVAMTLLKRKAEGIDQVIASPRV